MYVEMCKRDLEVASSSSSSHLQQSGRTSCAALHQAVKRPNVCNALYALRYSARFPTLVPAAGSKCIDSFGHVPGIYIVQ